MTMNSFNKKDLSKLLTLALGKRNMSEYALHSKVSLTYISELIRQERTNPPMPKTLKKLANKAHNGVTYEQLLAAAGHINLETAPPLFPQQPSLSSDELALIEKYRKMEERQKKAMHITAESYLPVEDEHAFLNSK